MRKAKKMVGGGVAMLAALVCLGANIPPADGPQYTSDGRLQFPAEYRQWVFLSSGLGMTYGPLASGREPMFDNVFVNPSAYRAFLETGRWPDKTVLVLEVRSAQSKGSINKAGHFQSDLAGIETHVKDEKRFPRKWAFFGFSKGAAASEPAAAQNSSCFSCHEPNGAVDTTFVQFYPALLPVARAKGTMK